MRPWEMFGVFKIPPCRITANASLCGKTDEKLQKKGLQWDRQENYHFKKVVIEPQKLDQKGNYQSLLDHTVAA